MWTVIKIKSNAHGTVKEELKKKLNKEFQVYNPKILVQINNKKPINKSISLLGDYIFCFHEDFKNNKIIIIKIY